MLPTSSAESLLSAGGLGVTYVHMGAEEARALFRERYGIDGSLTRMATEKDDTYRVESRRGRYVLKVANPAEDPEEVGLEVALLRHVAVTDATLPVPRLVPDGEGAVLSTVVDRAGQTRLVRVLTFLDGTPWGAAPSSPAQREEVGDVLAAMRFATAGFSHPAESRSLAWDALHVLELDYLLGHVADPAHRRQLASGLGRLRGLMGAVGRLRTQVLHNDFNKSNIVVDPEGPDFVAGILDFGDAVRTAIAVDVATALLNQLAPVTATDSDLFREARDVLRGYLRRADLTREELALVPHMVMARVIARELITTCRAQLFPDNAPYILRNSAPGRAQLEWFLARPTDEISEVLL